MRKVFIVLAALLAVAVMATPAVAGKGKGKGLAKKRAGCKAVAYVFEGTVTSVTSTSISADVVEANKHAQAFGAAVTLTVDAATKVVRDDARVTIADVLAGDSVTLQARACKGADPATTTLVARMVSATSPVVEEPVVEEPIV
ncbi:MAG: hypothetical protein KY396_09270 [Actinobacteria bacterium]|nr:hypothetical protein [Actinomycetota bacterium]